MADDGMQNNNGGGAAAGGSADGTQNPFGFLPEGLESLSQGYEEPSAFWADVSRLKGMDAELAAVRGTKPESLVSDEDWEKTWKALGRSDDKSGYKLPETWSGKTWTPDGPGDDADADVTAAVNKYLTDSGEREQFADIARRCDLTQKQSETLFGLYGGLLARHIGAKSAADAVAAPEKVMAELWGENAQTGLETARRGARAAGLGDELDAAGLSGNPLVLRLAHALGEALGEDSVRGGKAAGAALPMGAAAREELLRVVGSEAYRNNDPEAQRRAEALSARVHMK